MTLAALRRGDLAGATHLRLRNITAVPTEIFGLADSLEILDLSDNPLTDLPADISRLHRLRVLFCSQSQITRLPPALGDCPSLSQLGIRGGVLSEIPGESLPPRLRWLTVTDNRLTALPDDLGRRPALEKLLLSGNQLARLPESLGDLPRLELLRLSANQLERLPPWLTQLPCLAWPAWAGNPFDRTIPPAARAMPWADLSGAQPLGEGASGLVQAMKHAPSDETVAVKLFKGRMTSDGLPEREIAATLAAGRHPHLLSALGRITGHPEGRDGLVLPLLPSGMRTLAAPPSLESCTRDVYDEGLCLPFKEALRIARAIASAVAHLHARGLIHGDLYAHNILWDERHAVLTDFGGAGFLPEGAEAGLLAKIEVRAFGILLQELLDRADTPAPALAELSVACRQPSLTARPTMAEVVDRLDTLSPSEA
ncbi:leucine-rich repeat-containing protein kinase family protein [Acidisoma sp. 7E03]